MKRLCAAIAVCLLTLQAGLAQSADEQYIRIYQAIQEGDRLNEAGQLRAAAGKYLEAQENLRRFQSVYPGWNDRVINFRLNYVATKISALAGAAVPATNAPPATSPTAPEASTPPAPSPAAAPVTPAIPVELQQQLASLHEEVERLEGENRKLNAKLKEALSVQPAAVDPRELARAEERIRGLEKENALLHVRVRTTPAASETPSADQNVAELEKKVAEQAETMAALRSENDVLKRQAAELQKRVESAAAQPATVPGPPASDEKDAAIRKLNEEIVGLQKERALLKQAIEQREKPGATGTVGTDQLETLRARIGVLEAAAVPYTAEELALLNRSGMTLVHANARALPPATQPPPAEGAVQPKRVSKDVPPGAGPLVRAAERAFALRDFAEAERKYLDVLRQDEDNVSTLANLATAQLELGRIEAAEKNVTKALALDPDDHFTLYVLGRIRFQQDKLDEALDALSRSAQSNPEYAETQNYLGIVLSEKGLRIPAEAALRKAVQLQPNHAAAHNNLAVVYATQKPPALALARWHYQKALAAGHPKNGDLEKLLEQK